jgi:hypothetical protein
MQVGLCFMSGDSLRDIAEVKITDDPSHNRKEFYILRRFVRMWEGCTIEAYKVRGIDTERRAVTLAIPKGKRKAVLCVDGVDLWAWLAIA